MLIATIALLLLAFAATPVPAPVQISTQGLRRRIAKRLRTLREGVRRRRAPDADLGMIVAEVATRLRTGANPQHAWQATLNRAGIRGGNQELDEAGVPPALRVFGHRRWRKVKPETALAVASAIAVCRLSHSSGAPMADVLDACAGGISEATEAASARTVALAGPQTSAQMIAWMPLLGIVLGSALGAEPVDFLLGSWFGRIVLLFALGLEVAGIMWVRRLVASAEEATG